MIKLPDIANFKEVQDLLRLMGCSTKPPYNVIETPLDTPQSIQKIKGNPITGVLYGPDINSPTGQSPIAIYIKAWSSSYHHESEPNYKFHLTMCSTINTMLRNKRGSRYVSTTRKDGYFSVIPPNNGAKEELRKLEICYNCLKILLNKRLIPFNTKTSTFSIEEFFKSNPQLINQSSFRPESSVSSPNEYTPDWDQISNKKREAAHWKCSICTVDCRNNHELLGVHHRDGNKRNNIDSNLQVLCYYCHSKQPNHSHMNSTDTMDKIKRLRQSQGIF